MRYLASTIRFLLRNRLTSALVFLTCLVCLPALFAQSGGFGNAFLDVQIHAAPVIAWIEGQPDLVYELHITNFRPATLTLTRLDERGDYGEDRYQTIGLLGDEVVMVVWTPRGEDRRVISMRKCNARERDFFHEEVARGTA